MSDWNPELYKRFEAARTRPALDLALRCRTILGERTAPSIVDLGCGPGNSTAVLAQVFPASAAAGKLTGMDSSPAMIENARKTAAEHGGRANWEVADVDSWEPGQTWDLVFSNAMLQWSANQEAALARMVLWTAPGGLVAFQVPGNGDSPLHRALRTVASRPEWAGSCGGLDDAIRYKEPDWFQDRLEALDLEVDAWESTYWHVLPDHGALIDWYSGTGMRPWLNRLDPDSQERFKAAVLEAAAPSYPVRKDGSLYFPFRRIFLTARK